MSEINWKFILPAAIASFAGGQVGARVMSSRLKGEKITARFWSIWTKMTGNRDHACRIRRMPFRVTSKDAPISANTASQRLLIPKPMATKKMIFTKIENPIF